jgi:hypothetical protein
MNFTAFWPGFHPAHFRMFFPYVFEKYDLALSNDPEVVFYSVYSKEFVPYANPRTNPPLTRIQAGKYVRVFLTGENFEPDMSTCEFAISFSSLVDHENHLRLPLWVYENRAWGYPPELLIKHANTDWEKVAIEKTKFCNFVYLHPVAFRDAIFKQLTTYKPVDSAGSHLNTMNGWTVPMTPSRVGAKVEFFRRYKFTLAIENAIWPGYMTEKLVDPMFAHSIPIYVGDPQAQLTFDTSSYVDFARFRNVKQMLEFVREVDNDRALYLKLLAAPWYRNNAMPDYAYEQRIAAFFDRIFASALSRR